MPVTNFFFQQDFHRDPTEIIGDPCRMKDYLFSNFGGLLLEGLTTPVVVVKKEKITFVNESGAVLFKRKRNSLVGQSARIIFGHFFDTYVHYWMEMKARGFIIGPLFDSENSLFYRRIHFSNIEFDSETSVFIEIKPPTEGLIEKIFESSGIMDGVFLV